MITCLGLVVLATIVAIGALDRSSDLGLFAKYCSVQPPEPGLRTTTRKLRGPSPGRNHKRPPDGPGEDRWS